MAAGYWANIGYEIIKADYDPIIVSKINSSQLLIIYFFSFLEKIVENESYLTSRLCRAIKKIQEIEQQKRLF